MVQPVPVTLIAGFLGAGKTTLLRRILSGEHGLRMAVLVNDFGSLNIDARLVADVAEDVVALANGCLCCTVANGLSATLRRMAARVPRPEHLLIECSGVAEPDRVAASLGHPSIRAGFRLDCVVTLVDLAAELPRGMRDLTESQIAAADIVILNKADLATPDAARAFRRDHLFPDSRVLEAVQADVPLPLILESAFHDRVSSRVFVASADAPALFDSLTWSSGETVSLEALRCAIAGLPPQVFRAKGVFRTDALPGEEAVLHLVGGRIDWSRRRAAAERSEIVLIGPRGSLPVGALRAALDGCRVQRAGGAG